MGIMRVFSYIAFSLTLALAFCWCLPNDLSFTVMWMSSVFVGLPLLIADVIALVYLIRHRNDRGTKGLFILLVLIPIVITIGNYAPWKSVSDKTMSRHYHQHESDFRELVQYAESLSDSISISFPSDSILSQISKDQYDKVLSLLKRTRCEGIRTYSCVIYGNHTSVIFRTVGFGSAGYVFFPDNNVKIFRWDPLGSDWSGLYEIE